MFSIVLLLTIPLLLTAHQKIIKSAPNGRVVCYYGSWATYRPGLGEFEPENIDPFVCTHAIYTFAGLDPTMNVITSLDPYNDLPDNYGKGAYLRFTNLTRINPDLKVILAIGGWNEGSQKYSEMADDDESRRTFIESIVPFLKKYGFQGLDVDWEYPTQRDGQPQDRVNFVKLLKGLRKEFDKYGLLLSAAVSGGKPTIDDAYIVPEISKYLDYINIMCYDYHGTWEPFTGENSPVYARPGETPDQQTFNVNYSIQYWLANGAPAEKINLGMPMYGHVFMLASDDNGVYAPSNGPGEQGPYTQEAGTLGYNEICVMLSEGGWTIVRDDYTKEPYAYQGNQWFSFDDAESIAVKCQIGLEYGVGGGMIWSIETDDFQGTCGSKFPLLAAINENFRAGYTTPAPLPTLPNMSSTSPSQATTLEPAASTPAPTPAPTDICKRPGYQADPIDCNKFYDCVPMPDGTWAVFPFHCYVKLVFDPKIDACNYPEDVPDCHADRLSDVDELFKKDF